MLDYSKSLPLLELAFKNIHCDSGEMALQKDRNQIAHTHHYNAEIQLLSSLTVQSGFIIFFNRSTARNNSYNISKFNNAAYVLFIYILIRKILLFLRATISFADIWVLTIYVYFLTKLQWFTVLFWHIMY